jgi:7-cyano-7-deazaguanine reductase
MNSDTRGLTQLGSKTNEPTTLLESFDRPGLLELVELTSDEVTALCPVTGQPDQYTVTIRYVPKNKCIESKSLKLKLQSLRQVGVFCEDLSSQLLVHVIASISPRSASVTVVQKPRGGVSIRATSNYEKQQ